MKKCAYCDEKRKTTKEHIWPKCIINRMPELEAKYVSSQKKFVSSELTISDVCAECNNTKLSSLDAYLCQLYDQYFKTYIEEKQMFVFEYDYELLLRSLLKITYNSSRTVNKLENIFAKYRKFIKDGGENVENITINLDIVLPSTYDGKKIYPKSARCGSLNIGIASDSFILRVISINSFYFYIMISKDEKVNKTDFFEVFNRIPGTNIHPYSTKTEVNQSSNSNTYDSHIDFIVNTKDSFEEYIDGKKQSEK